MTLLKRLFAAVALFASATVFHMKMQSIGKLGALAALLCALVAPAQASLMLRYSEGAATMVYDSEANLTWLLDAGMGGQQTWADADAWATGLSFGGRDDWRLPMVTPVAGAALNLDYSEDGSTDSGINTRGLNSELGFLFYQTLGNSAATGLTQVGLFQNLRADTAYWSGTNSLYAGEALHFFNAFGDQGSSDKGNSYYAWAVRSGDVPEPMSAALVLIALGALALSRRKSR